GIRPVAGPHGRCPQAPAIAIRNRPSALPLPGPLFPAGFALPQPRRTPKPAPWRSVLRPLHRATLAPCRGPVPPRTTTVMIGVPAGGTGGMVREGDGEGDKSANGEWRMVNGNSRLGGTGRGICPREDAAASQARRPGSFAPPSVLPDISPTRGEIGC